MDVSFKIQTKSGLGKNKVRHMCDIENSEHFGELSLIFGGKRTATVTTRESCFALVVKK